MQIHYHVDIIKKYACPLIVGWHIEEAIYCDYYGEDPDSPYYKTRFTTSSASTSRWCWRAHLPDVVMFHVTASDEEIASRMARIRTSIRLCAKRTSPRSRERFDEEVEKSLFTHQGRTVVLDTTDKTPQQSFDELLALSRPKITMGELAVRGMAVPEGEVVYENGVRKCATNERRHARIDFDTRLRDLARLRRPPVRFHCQVKSGAPADDKTPSPTCACAE